MAGISRRAFGAGLATSGLSIMTGAQALAAEQFALPSAPMRLSRRITRGLADGNSIIVDREWRVSFAPQGRGIAVTGSQISAKVDAPPRLAPIAQIEEARSTDGMWPILLSDRGRIVAAGDEADGADVAAAARAAERMVAKSGEPQAAKAGHIHYLAMLERASAALSDRLPADLFFPSGDERKTVRDIDLPEGMRGEFEVLYSASSALGGPWLYKATRQITTRIGKDARQSRDEWEMVAF